VTFTTIVDAGPLVALLNQNDTHHEWAVAQFGRLKAPLLTCEAAVSEASFLLKSRGADAAFVLDLMDRGVFRIGFSLGEELEPVRRLMRRYADVGASLADICLVRMSELHPKCKVLTTDRDFLIYRRDGRRIIPLIAPFDA